MKPIKFTPLAILFVVGIATAATGGTYYILQKKDTSFLPPQSFSPQIIPPPNTLQPPTFPVTQLPPKISPQPIPTPISKSQSMSVVELWEKRKELINKYIIVKDLISFKVNCPSVEPLDPDSCGTTVLIGPHPPDTDYFHLSRNNQHLVCSGSPNICQGFERGKTYTVAGRLSHCGYQNMNYCFEIDTH